MSRIDTMARFKEPEDDKPVTSCAECNAILYENEVAYRYNGETFCSPKCLADALSEKVLLKVDMFDDY